MENNTIVNVMNFGPYTSEYYIKQMFEKYGNIKSFGIMNKDNAVCRFVYIAFEDSDAADEAVIEMNGQQLDDGRRIRVRRTRKKDRSHKASGRLNKDDSSDVAGGVLNSLENPPEEERKSNACTVHVKNLDRAVQPLQLRIAFEPYGRIIWVKVIMGPSGSRGYGFVEFSKKEEAQRAVNEMSGRLVRTQIIKCEIARGTDKFPRFQPNRNLSRSSNTSLRNQSLPDINELSLRSINSASDCEEPYTCLDEFF